MDIFVNGALPLSLVVIMLSLGIGLTLDDFKRVMIRPEAFAIGAGAQIVFVPLMAYLMTLMFGITGELALGIMLLSLCPGGVTTNIATKIAKGDVALSVSLTAVVSLLNIITVPFVASWSVIHFMGANAPEVTITGLALAVFVVTTIPVLLGMTVRYLRPGFSIRIEPTFSLIGAGLFSIIVVAALFSGWDTFTANISKWAPFSSHSACHC
ncbi:bile acid:sodium symporter [bacterium]|nr:bile acid:sodium symporter [bacterium]